MKSIFIAAIIAAACSGIATAAEVKQDKSAPAVKSQVMSDTEMDKMTAGVGNPNPFILILPNNPHFFFNVGGHSNICINIKCV